MSLVLYRSPSEPSFFHIECSLFCKESDSKAIYDVFEIFGSHLLTLMNVLTNSALTNVNRYSLLK